jgi:cytochrome c-type biogenesis protein CcmH
MTPFLLLAALLCALAVAWLTRPWWWPARVPAGSSEATPRPSPGLAVVLTLFVLVVAAGGYWGLGSPSYLAVGPGTSDAGAAGTPAGATDQESLARAAEQVNTMVNQLAERLKAQPDDAEGWQMLGRSYVALGRHAEAVDALGRASKLRPEDATLMVDHAFAMAMAQQRSFAGEPAKLIARALALEPKNPKVLALAGTSAFDHKDFPMAVKLWEQLAQIEPPGSPLGEQIQASIAQARQLAGMPPANAVPRAAAATPTQLSGTVSLAPALKGRVGPDDTLYVFARAASGPRMPLAILKLRAKDLPLPFKLDDSMAMSPAAKLSGASQVVVGARISKTGDATPQPGDLQGLTQAVAVGSSGIKLEINEEVAK